MRADPLPLFPDLPVPVGRNPIAPHERNPIAPHGNVGAMGLRPTPAYVPRCAPMRTAQYFSRELVRARPGDRRRKTECYLNMVAAILAKDGAQ